MLHERNFGLCHGSNAVLKQECFHILCLIVALVSPRDLVEAILHIGRGWTTTLTAKQIATRGHAHHAT